MYVNIYLKSFYSLIMIVPKELVSIQTHILESQETGSGRKGGKGDQLSGKQ